MTKHHKTHLIEINLREMNQLFNSMDPSPFNEKDLDHNAEDFIVSWAQEFPVHEPIKLRIYLDQWPTENPQAHIQEAIHHYFSYKENLTHLEFRRLLLQGRTSLIIGLSFLTICALILKIYFNHQNPDTWVSIISESLTIAGWVAMWRPMQIYLYDWWPLRRRVKIYQKLSKMPVEILKQKHPAQDKASIQKN